MGTLYLVRHGQASFGTHDYDRLSELGTRQCHALGAWLAERGVSFEAVLRGSLKRHEQSLAALAQGHGKVPEALVWPGLNEYDSEAIVRAVHSGPLEAPTTPEGRREHFRLLRQGLVQWVAGGSQTVGMPSWDVFLHGVTSALDHVRTQHTGDVLIVSSGGPIATAVAHVLGAPPESFVELNLRIRNSSLTEFVFAPKRHALLSFNQVPHLHAAERRDWETWA